MTAVEAYTVKEFLRCWRITVGVSLMWALAVLILTLMH